MQNHSSRSWLIAVWLCSCAAEERPGASVVQECSTSAPEGTELVEVCVSSLPAYVDRCVDCGRDCVRKQLQREAGCPGTWFDVAALACDPEPRERDRGCCFQVYTSGRAACVR